MDAFESIRPLRVLVADDSMVMRSILNTLFERHHRIPYAGLPPMELIEAVRDGVECLEAIERLRPDLLVLDLEMPRLNGLGVLEALQRRQQRLPVIMCSSYTVHGARATLDALARGAADYVMKPAGQSGLQQALNSLAEQLLPRIAALASASDPERASRTSSYPRAASQAAANRSEVEAVVIGVSTGGPAALEQLLPRLPADLSAPVLIVQHMPKLFTGVFAERLNRICRLRVAEAVAGAAVRSGTIWLAPGDAHLELAAAPSSMCMQGEAASKSVIRLHHKAPLNHCMPAVDYLFLSAARLYGDRALAVVLTGMGSDGLEGARAIRARGGHVLVQDEASSAVWGMPGRIVESGLASSVLALEGIAEEINRKVRRRAPGCSLDLRRSASPVLQEARHGLR